MRYTITFPEALHRGLLQHLEDSENEAAAYLLCRQSASANEVRLLPRKLLPVAGADIISTSRTHMSIRSRSFLSAMKEADRLKCSFVFVHSHPGGPRKHSAQDDAEETMLFRTAYNRIKNSGTHGSLVVDGGGSIVGRVWLANGTQVRVSTIRVIGSRFRFYFEDLHEVPTDIFDRHIRGFGSEIQPMLSNLHIGVVGAGGTGSSVAEQLIRLGVGALSIVDGGRLEKSNVTRGYGSSFADVGAEKPALLSRLAKQIGFGTRVHTFSKDCTFLSTASALRECDIIFGCTDDQFGRSLLNLLAVYYLIPVFDMGVQIESKNGIIESIQGRVTTLLPGAACLSCRGRVAAEAVRREALQAINPAEAGRLEREGYVPELPGPASSMIPFTTALAATAVIEFLHRLTQLGGTDRKSTEVLQLFDQTRMRTNAVPPKGEGCFCDDEEKASRGDCAPLLDILWRPE